MKLRAKRNMSGIYYPKTHILKFKNNRELISDNDIFDLVMGLINLIKKNTELKIEERYLMEIKRLKTEINILKNIN